MPGVSWLEADRQEDFMLASTFDDFVSGLEPLVKHQPAKANNRVEGNTIIWENFVAEEKLMELDEKFLTEVSGRRKKNGLPEIIKI